MSDLPNNNPPAAADAAAPKAVEPEAPAAEVIQPGVVCAQIIEKGFALEPVKPANDGIEIIVVPRDKALDVARMLQADLGFDLLVSAAGVDWKTHRQVVYHLMNTTTAAWLTLKIDADANEHMPSLTVVWPAADWHEREIFDLFGVQFDGHPNLTRILMPDDWIGYPLRKDYVLNDPRLVWNER